MKPLRFSRATDGPSWVRRTRLPPTPPAQPPPAGPDARVQARSEPAYRPQATDRRGRRLDVSGAPWTAATDRDTGKGMNSASQQPVE
ncbi:hypothetical protein VQ02_15305 [Methylobacterium variabile]|uniref:Uncharacterized protein n=1 Tax=Methylobacterium variabile TaxID=298794 RepID=A0A0J6VBY2_9HYPH|nr:hypothetical protein VQ02_15305 [Methylobacterium variabile]